MGKRAVGNFRIAKYAPIRDELLRESYEELCRVTKRANYIEREAQQLRKQSAALATRIDLLLRVLDA